MMREPLPDTEEAKAKGCTCQRHNTVCAADGEGLLPVSQWLVDQKCPIHTRPEAWLAALHSLLKRDS